MGLGLKGAVVRRISCEMGEVCCRGLWALELGLCGSWKKCIEGVAVREIAVFWGQVKATSGGERRWRLHEKGAVPHTKRTWILDCLDKRFGS